MYIVTSTPYRKKLQKIKNYAKADIMKVFQSLPVLLYFFTLFEIFFPGLFVLTNNFSKGPFIG